MDNPNRYIILIDSYVYKHRVDTSRILSDKRKSKNFFHPPYQACQNIEEGFYVEEMLHRILFACVPIKELHKCLLCKMFWWAICAALISVISIRMPVMWTFLVHSSLPLPSLSPRQANTNTNWCWTVLPRPRNISNNQTKLATGQKK